MLQVSEPRNRKRITGIAYFELLEILRIFSPQTCLFLHLQVFLWPNVLGIPTWYWGWGAATRGIRNCGTAHPGSVRTSGLELTQLQIQIKAECEGGSGLQTPAKRKEEVSSSPSSHFLSNLPPLLLVREAALVSHQSPIIQLSTSLRSPTLAKKCMYIYIYMYMYIYIGGQWNLVPSAKVKEWKYLRTFTQVKNAHVLWDILWLWVTRDSQVIEQPGQSPMSWGKGASHLCWNLAVPEPLVTQASTVHACDH